MNKNTQQLPLMDFVAKDEIEKLNEVIELQRATNAELIEKLKTATERVEEIERVLSVVRGNLQMEVDALQKELKAERRKSELHDGQLVQWSINVLPMLRAWRAMAVGFAPQGLNQQGVVLLQRANTMIDEMALLVK